MYAIIFVVFTIALAQVKASDNMNHDFSKKNWIDINECRTSEYGHPLGWILDGNNYFIDDKMPWVCDKSSFVAQDVSRAFLGDDKNLMDLHYRISPTESKILSKTTKNLINSGFAEVTLSVLAATWNTNYFVSARLEFSYQEIRLPEFCADTSLTQPLMENRYCNNEPLPLDETCCQWTSPEYSSQDFHNITMSMRVPKGTNHIRAIFSVRRNVNQKAKEVIATFKEPILKLNHVFKIVPGVPESVTAFRIDESLVKITWTLPEIHENFDNAFTLVEVLRVELGRNRSICSGSSIIECIDRKRMSTVFDHVDTLHYIVVVSNPIGETTNEVITDEWAYTRASFTAYTKTEINAIHVTIEVEKRLPPNYQFLVFLDYYEQWRITNTKQKKMTVTLPVQPNSLYEVEVQARKDNSVQFYKMMYVNTIILVEAPYIEYLNETAVRTSVYLPSIIKCNNVSLFANTNSSISDFSKHDDSIFTVITTNNDISNLFSTEIANQQDPLTIQLNGLASGVEYFFQTMCTHDLGDTLSPIVTMTSLNSPPVLNNLTMRNMTLFLEGNSQWTFVEVFTGYQTPFERRIHSEKNDSSLIFLSGLAPLEEYSIRYYTSADRRWSEVCTVRIPDGLQVSPPEIQEYGSKGPYSLFLNLPPMNLRSVVVKYSITMWKYRMNGNIKVIKRTDSFNQKGEVIEFKGLRPNTRYTIRIVSTNILEMISAPTDVTVSTAVERNIIRYLWKKLKKLYPF